MNAPASLSNRLAERAGEAARAYRRCSIDAIGAYVRAGDLLAEARGECRRGEWGAVLARAGIGERAGRLMVQAARLAGELGASPEAIHEAGGIQAFIAAAVEKPALNAGIEAPEPDESPALAHETPSAGGESRDMREGGPADDPRPPVDPANVTMARAMGEDAALSPAARRRADKLARSECLDCSRPTDGEHVRCPQCRARIAEADRRRRERARLGAAEAPRLAEAARTGRGVRLTAAEVAALAGPDPELAT